MPPSDPKNEKMYSKAGFSRVFGVRSGFRFSMPSALPIKFICDVTRL